MSARSKIEQRNAEKVCDILNRTFGYQYALDLLLKKMEISSERRKILLKLARDRQFIVFIDLLNMK